MEAQQEFVDKLRQPFKLAELTARQMTKDEFKNGANRLQETDPDQLIVISESLNPGETAQRKLQFGVDGAVFYTPDTSSPRSIRFALEGGEVKGSEDIPMATAFEPFKDIVVPLERTLVRVLLAGGGESQILWNQISAGLFDDQFGQVAPEAIDGAREKFARDAVLGKVNVTPKPNMSSGSAGGQFAG